MNLDELATNVARDIGVVRQKSCKRVDEVEYHFEQSELEQFAKELITEYEKTVNSELYPRPDPRVAELEAKLQQMNSLCEFNERTMSDIANKYEALEAQNSALLVAIEAKQKALNWAFDYDGDVFGINHNDATDALAFSPSAELLEKRDRKRDAKLLRYIALGQEPCAGVCARSPAPECYTSGTTEQE